MLNVRESGMLRRRCALVAAVVAAGFVAVHLVSCAPAAQQAPEPRLANTGKPALHAVFSEELQTDMRELNRLHSSQMRAELYSGNKFQPDMDKVAAAADSMAKAATHIPDAIKGVKMDEPDQRFFLSLCEKLRIESVQLMQDANSRDYSAARATMERITATCNACHTAFRSLAGVPKT
jgi:hypothetical protein